MKRFMMIAVALVGMTVGTATVAEADHWHGRGRGGSGFGISVNYGSGFNNFSGHYGRGGFGHIRPYGVYGGGYPVYRSTQVYSVPVYSVPVYGGFGGYGGHYGHRHCH
jgi:hypothetical protein